MRQLERAAELPGVVAVAGLPDLHSGGGIPVGAAVASRGVFHPGLIGNDIGCGMSLWRTTLRRRRMNPDRWAAGLAGLEAAWDGDRAPWLDAHGAGPTDFDESLGTIGGGNHFAEIHVIEKLVDADAAGRLGLDGDAVCILIHSGSRGLGSAVLRAHGAEPIEEGSARAEAYLAGHDHAVRWARANRALLAHRMTECLGGRAEVVSDVAHNLLERLDTGGGGLWLHRKGAASALAGPVVIPGSRGSLSYLVEPIPSEASLWSLAHGAGRRHARSQSGGRKDERTRDMLRSEVGARVICADRSLLLAHAPSAYKNIEVVVGDLVDAGLARVIAALRPVVSYKTREVGR